MEECNNCLQNAWAMPSEFPTAQGVIGGGWDFHAYTLLDYSVHSESVVWHHWKSMVVMGEPGGSSSLGGGWVLTSPTGIWCRLIPSSPSERHDPLETVPVNLRASLPSDYVWSDVKLFLQEWKNPRWSFYIPVLLQIFRSRIFPIRHRGPGFRKGERNWVW